MKNLRLYIILIVLLIIAGIFYFSNSKGTLNLKHTSFAIDSPEDITKIEITSGNNILILSNDYGKWKVNNKYLATEKYVSNFISALNRIMVLSPVSKAEKQQVTSILKSDGTQVKIFKKRRVLKEFYVSKPGMNPEKTFMMMKKSSDPYIVRIPSFDVSLARLFVVNENYWRNKAIFDYEPQNIHIVRVEYPQEPLKSFKVINYNDGTFAIQNMSNNNFIKDFNVEKVARYFTYYQRITFEDVVTDLSQSALDSIHNSTPYCNISVEDDQGRTNKITIYRKPSEKTLDEFGQKIEFDYDRAYAAFNDNNELIQIQYYIFDPLFKEIDYFR